MHVHAREGDYNFTIMNESSTRLPDRCKITTAVAEPYVWGDGCDGWHLVRTPGLSVISERMPPGTSEVAYRHAHAQQFFFVLSGELVLESAVTRHVLPAREGSHVVHQALNAIAYLALGTARRNLRPVVRRSCTFMRIQDSVLLLPNLQANSESVGWSR